MKFRRIIGFGILAAVLLFGLIQLVPYGRNHTNPPVVQEPKWDSPATQAIAQRACFDCHSNKTVWPWYSNIAPASWLVYRDVVEGREEMNFTDWGDRSKSAKKLAEVIESRKMPPRQYLLMHPEARLSDAEIQQFVAGLRKTLP